MFATETEDKAFPEAARAPFARPLAFPDALAASRRALGADAATSAVAHATRAGVAAHGAPPRPVTA